MTLSWANGNFNAEPSWEVFSADLPAHSGSFDLAFSPPLEAVSNSVLIRLDVVDPMGREWAAFSTEYIAVVEDVDGGCEEEGDFVDDPCAEDTGTDSGDETATDEGSGSETGPNVDDGGGGAGCSCSTPEAPGAGFVFWSLAGVVLVGVGRRTRR